MIIKLDYVLNDRVLSFELTTKDKETHSYLEDNLVLRNNILNAIRDEIRSYHEIRNEVKEDQGNS